MSKHTRPKNWPAHIHWNTPEEEAEINRGIALDPDNPEWTEEDFKRARPAREVMGNAFVNQMERERERRLRGPQKAPTKELISVRLDRDVLAQLRAGGRGWQARMNAILRKSVLG